ncbi:MAG: ParB/RepB/Spo0J family partition protein [Parvibaculaceae bacterium]
MELRHIPLPELHVATSNVRHKTRKPDLSDILPSIRKRGILQPLLVRPDTEGFGIVAGRRRYFAAKALEQEGHEVQLLPCAVMDDADDAAAVEASLIENMARLEMDEMDQFEAFQRLLKEGRTVTEIAATFAVSEIVVRRRLAIANLLPRVRQAYRAGEINSDSLQALTMATKSQQKEWLAMFEDAEQVAPTGSYLKKWLLGGEQISTATALFDLAEYTGEVVTDLFGDESYFADTTAFWKLQNAAIEAKKGGYLDLGWKRVEVLPVDHRFNVWEYEKTSKKKCGAVYIAVSGRGAVEVHEGYVSRQEARKREKKKETDGAEAKTEKAELTKAAQNYLELHRHAAVRLRLIEEPKVALRLAVAHMIAGSRLWQVRPEPQRADKEEIAASVQNGQAQAKFDEAKANTLAALGLAEDRGDLVRHTGDSDATTAIFSSLLKLGDDEVLAILAVAMAETIEAGTAITEITGTVLAADMAKDWKPDQTFLDLVTDKMVLNSMLVEVAGASVAAANRDATGRVQRNIIRDVLNGSNGREHKPDWVPGYASFPAKSYTDRGGLSFITEWEKAAHLLTNEEQ